MRNDQNSIHWSGKPSPGLIAYCSIGVSLLRLRSTPPHTVRFYLIRGRLRLSLGQYEQAVSDFRHALRLDWRHDEAASWLDKARRAALGTGAVGSLT